MSIRQPFHCISFQQAHIMGFQCPCSIQGLFRSALSCRTRPRFAMVSISMQRSNQEYLSASFKVHCSWWYIFVQLTNYDQYLLKNESLDSPSSLTSNRQTPEVSKKGSIVYQYSWPGCMNVSSNVPLWKAQAASGSLQEIYLLLLHTLNDTHTHTHTHTHISETCISVRSLGFQSLAVLMAQ